MSWPMARIITTGGKDLAHELENRGYEWILAEHKAEVAVCS